MVFRIILFQLSILAYMPTGICVRKLCPFVVVMGENEHHFIEQRTNSNIIFRTSTKHEHVHILVVELKYY